MKVIKCEQCGSYELKKIDGEFVCQHCGTKYTFEEARKLMFEIEGTVKVDNFSQVTNNDRMSSQNLHTI